MTGPFSANIILSNPTVDVAVLETARGGDPAPGLGFDEADVGVVLNVSADHLGPARHHTLEQLADVKGVIPAVVKREGHAVLNADDPLVYAMRDRTPGRRRALLDEYLTARTQSVAEHICARRHRGAYRERDLRHPARASCESRSPPVREVPLMLGGAARFQRENMLAAIATAYVQGMRYDDIRAGLLSFFPSPSLTPGRLNLMRVRDGDGCCVDYAHNAAAIAGLMEFVQNLDASRRIGVVTAPGDRRDDDLRTVGRLASCLDYVIVKEDTFRRGREPGQISDLIIDGLREGGLRESQYEIIYNENEAITKAIERMQENDLVVILADDVTASLDLIRKHSADGVR